MNAFATRRNVALKERFSDTAEFGGSSEDLESLHVILCWKIMFIQLISLGN